MFTHYCQCLECMKMAKRSHLWVLLHVVLGWEEESSPNPGPSQPNTNRTSNGDNPLLASAALCLNRLLHIPLHTMYFFLTRYYGALDDILVQ